MKLIKFHHHHYYQYHQLHQITYLFQNWNTLEVRKNHAKNESRGL